MIKKDGSRLLIYSHDSFGLGHLRRCRTIAHHLVEEFKSLSVLILSGSPIIGSFDFRARVDFVRVPGVIKLRSGDYTPLSLHIDIEETLAMRESIIQHTALKFRPDVFLVDKEPLGLRGEVEPTLKLLKDQGTQLVLGLRDVMDDPEMLEQEWERKQVRPALVSLYDEIWTFGLPELFDPVEELPSMSDLSEKMFFTGYLPRSVPEATLDMSENVTTDEPYILVTAGGGGDGAELVDWVISAYETDPTIKTGALVVMGPFMAAELRKSFLDRAAVLDKVHAITFDAQFERLVDKAVAVVGMGGYNTFCEIISFGKPSLIVPRMVPRKEQWLRTSRAQQLGLVDMLIDDGVRHPQAMADKLHQLPHQRPPDTKTIPDLLAGLDRISELMSRHIAHE